MPLISRCLRAGSSIVETQGLRDGLLGVVTAKDGVYLVDSRTCKTLSRMRIEELDPFEHGTAFSPDGRYFCFAHNTSKGNAIRLIEIASKRLVRSYATQDNPIGILSFDPTSTYIVAGTLTGRVMVWRIDGSILIARLSSFPEHTPNLFATPTKTYISAIAYSATRIATAGYGGSVVVTNFHTLTHTKRIRPGKIRIDALAFIDERYLVTGNVHGVIERIDTLEEEPIRQLIAPIGPIRHLLILPRSGLLLAASKFTHIALIDIKSMQIIEEHYLTLPSPIHSMTYLGDDQIAIGLDSGTVVQVELTAYLQMKEAIDKEDFEEAYGLSDAEPLIKESEQYRILNNRFRSHYSDAFQAFSRHDDETALTLLRPFKTITQTKREVQELITAFSEYDRLRLSIEEQRYSVAYGLAERYPPLRQTAQYKTLEEEWERRFTEAQAYMFKDDPDQVKQVLNAFITVPSKSVFIRLLLHKTQLLLDFSRAIHDEDYETLKRVSDQEPALKETPAYQASMHAADELIDAIMNAIRSNRFEKAEQRIEKLLAIPHLLHRHDELMTLLKKARRLYQAHSDRLILHYYELLDRSQELSHLPQAKAVEKAWKRLMQRCEKEALVGNTAAIKRILGPLIDLPTRSEKIGNLLRVSYQMQVKHHLARKEYEKTRRAISHYLSIFGMDNETRQLITRLELKGEAFTPDEEQELHRPRTLWHTLTHGDVPDHIISL